MLRIVFNAEADGPDSRYALYDYHPILIEVIFFVRLDDCQEGMSMPYMNSGNDMCQSFVAIRRRSKEAFVD
jgi:hypothetical protein